MAGLEWLTHDDFADRVGEEFSLTTEVAPTVVLTLVETAEGSQVGGRGPEGQERRQFSLVFRGPGAPVLAQATYGLAHADLGDLELFLVPIGPDGEGMRYEAAFA